MQNLFDFVEYPKKFSVWVIHISIIFLEVILLYNLYFCFEIWE